MGGGGDDSQAAVGIKLEVGSGGAREEVTREVNVVNNAAIESGA